jgi:tetratricopeptide (TPR) repeat protein
LDISLDAIPTLLLNKQEEIKELNFRLLGVDSLHQSENTHKALEILDSLNIDDRHPLAAKAHLLRGRCLSKEGKLKKAERSFYKAIQLASQSEDNENIESWSFNELAIACYLQNDLESALQFVESGIDAFNRKGKREYLYWLLTLNKAIYLQRMNKIGESMSVVLQVWDLLDTIPQHYVINFYWLRAELLRQSDDLKDAEKYALEGAEIARRYRENELLFELWTLLGTIYVDAEKWDKAEFSLDQALAIKVSEHKLVTTYAWLGRLYTEQKQWEKAIEVLNKALELGEKYNDVSRYEETLRYMGDYYREKGEPREAIKHYQKVLNLSEKHNLKKTQYIALLRLAQCWEGIDKEEFQQATANMYRIQVEEGVKPFGKI